MLQNAVFNIPDLRQVKQQADQMMTQTGRKLTYAEYVALLSSAAAQYDKQLSGSLGTGLAKKHQVYSHDYDLSNEEYDIDTPVQLIQANQSVCREAMTPGPIWAKLTPTEQEVWDKLSVDTKMLILNARLRGDTSQRPPPAPNFKN